jgi:hypothetical protein
MGRWWSSSTIVKRMKGARHERQSALLLLSILVPMGTLVASCSDLIGLSKLDQVACVADCGASDAASDAPSKGCKSDTQCTSKSDPRCDVATGQCVACLPTNDNCPSGMFCNQFSDGTYECVSGCKVVGDCPPIPGADLACCAMVCVDTMTNAGDCGGCNACSSNHMLTITCGAGACNGNCDMGYADCDNDKQKDGCETDIDTDTSNCGGCGKACSANHVAMVTCGGGKCNGACSAGYADCNGDEAMDGCETDTMTDPMNCGKCGVICGGTCTAGMCTGGGCGRFAKGFTGAWSTAAVNPFGTQMGISNYVPATSTVTLFLNYDADLDSYSTTTNAYTALTAATVAMPPYGSTAWYADALWSFTSGDLISYDIMAGTWSTVKTGLTVSQDTQTTNDDSGNLWSFAPGVTSGGSTSLGQLIEYSVATGASSTITLPTPLVTSYAEPRIAFDSCTGLLYLTNYDSVSLYSFDPKTSAEVALPALPSSLTFEDGFCGDRSGHLFAVTNSPSTTAYQYTIATGTWEAMPTGGVIGSSNSACGVGADGFLYATDPAEGTTMYRIQLE